MTQPVLDRPLPCPRSPASGETWYCATEEGVAEMSFDELEAAFGRGELDTSTPVWTAGMTEWERLGVVANLEDGGLPDALATSLASSAGGQTGLLHRWRELLAPSPLIKPLALTPIAPLSSEHSAHRSERRAPIGRSGSSTAT